MTSAAAVFYILASMALVSAVMVIWSRNVVHSAIYLVLTFLCVAGVYVLLRAEFVAVVQVLVYAGGIVVLFLFVIMLVNLKDALGKRVRVHATLSALVGIAATVLLLRVVLSGGLPAASPAPALDPSAQGGNLQQVGWALYQNYLLPFEIASVLLLVAMIGAIVLARQKY
jgi:NADH-quinone oxidoreductase subunit J